jgi:hypothetical protein
MVFDLQKFIVEIFLMAIILILCIFMFTVMVENNRLKNKKVPIQVECPKPKCPDMPDIPKCEPCPKPPKCPDPPACPSVDDIVGAIFPGRGMDLADGSFAPAFPDNQTISKGIQGLDTSVNTVDSDYIIKKQSLDMDNIKKKLKTIGDGGPLTPGTTTTPSGTTTTPSGTTTTPSGTTTTTTPSETTTSPPGAVSP